MNGAGRLAATLLLVFAAGAAVAQGTRPCRLDGLAHEVLCGSLSRPLDPTRPDGLRFDLHYVVVPALARGKRPDPMVLLAGGPGQSAIAIAPSVMPLFARLNNRRDIVFVDQRGTGRSAPLECDDDAEPPLAEFGDADSELRRLAACRVKLANLPHVREAANLAFFTTPLAMQDLDAVRQALGVARWNLVGFSYGTRAALDYQRQFPQAVRRSVLDGVAPADMVLPASAAADGQAAFDSLLAACTAEVACRERWPQLRADWDRLVGTLPRPVTLADPRSGQPQTLTMTHERLLAAVRAPLYAPALAAALPAAISAAAQGRFEGLAGLAAVFAPRRALRVATGMHFGVVCAEDMQGLSRVNAPQPRDFGAGLVPLYTKACADWPRLPLPPSFDHVVPTATPVLLLSGGLDPATPPRHAMRVAAALGAKARHVVVANGGHGVLSAGCGPDLLFRFVDAEDEAAALALDTGCLTSIPRPPMFVAPGSAGASAVSRPAR